MRGLLHRPVWRVGVATKFLWAAPCAWLIPFCAGSFAHPVWGESLSSRIEQALSLPADDQTVVGAHIVDLQSGRTLYARNADRAFKPASNMKLFTTAAAINVLGADFQFETRVSLDGPNLIVTGSGDPLLAHPKAPEYSQNAPFEQFYSWADQLLARGITTIEGDLVIDDGVFDRNWTNPAWPQDQLHKHYCAPVGGLNLHGNCITARVMPESSMGDGEYAGYVLTPANPWVSIVNKCRAAGRGQPWLGRGSRADEFVLAGTCRVETDVGLVTVVDPGLFYGTSMRAYLAAKGVRVLGEVRRPYSQERFAGSSPDGSTTLHLSSRLTTLAEVLQRSNTDSLNLAAEALFRRMGHTLDSRRSSALVPGTWDGGCRAVRDFLERANLADPRLVVADGSGLSHDNRVTPEMMTGILRLMYDSPHRELYMASLARNGIDGTLRKRMKDIPGRLLGKTGYINGVRTLCGYLRTNDGSWLAVSIMHNGFEGPSTKYRNAEDRVCRLLLEAREH